MSIASLRDWVVLLSALALGAAAFWIFLPWIIQSLLRAILFPRYGFRVLGRENVPRTGPVLLAANHTSWLDGFILAAVSPRHGKALVNAGIVNRPILRPLALRAGIIPTPFSGPRAIRAAISETRAALDHGDAVGIFPEGQISRNGLTGPFFRGLEVILHGRDGVPVVPVALDNLWGSVFSRSGGRFFRKRPEGLRRTVNIVFGTPLPSPVTAFVVRQALSETMVLAYELRRGRSRPLDTLDPNLPRWDHPTLGLLTASTVDIELDGVRQLGQKPGTVGLPVPGVAIRAIDNVSGEVLSQGKTGRLQARVAGRSGWNDTGHLGAIDADGFICLADPTASADGP